MISLFLAKSAKFLSGLCRRGAVLLRLVDNVWTCRSHRSVFIATFIHLWRSHDASSLTRDCLWAHKLCDDVCGSRKESMLYLQRWFYVNVPVGWMMFIIACIIISNFLKYIYSIYICTRGQWSRSKWTLIIPAAPSVELCPRTLQIKPNPLLNVVKGLKLWKIVDEAAIKTITEGGQWSTRVAF